MWTKKYNKIFGIYSLEFLNIYERLSFFKRTKFSSRDTPKSILHGYTIKNNLPRPIYKTVEKKPERVYKSNLEMDNVIYNTPYW